MPVTREDIHRLVDEVPADRISAVGEVLRAAVEQTRIAPEERPAPARVFASAGMLSAENDLAERSEEILRTDDTNAA